MERNTDESPVNLAGLHSQRWQQRDIQRNSGVRTVLMSRAAGRRCSHRAVWLSLARYPTNPHIFTPLTPAQHIIVGTERAKGRVGRVMGTRTRLKRLRKPWKWKQWHHNSIWSKRMNETVDKHINTRVKGSKVTWEKNKQQDHDEWMESNLLLL